MYQFRKLLKETKFVYVAQILFVQLNDPLFFEKMKIK